MKFHRFPLEKSFKSLFAYPWKNPLLPPTPLEKIPTPMNVIHHISNQTILIVFIDGGFTMKFVIRKPIQH